MGFARIWQGTLFLALALSSLSTPSPSVAQSQDDKDSAPPRLALPSGGKNFAAASTFARRGIFFEANYGQVDPQVYFLARGRGYVSYLTKAGMTFDFRSPLQPYAVVRTRFAGANADARVTGMDELPGKSNYLLGRDPAQWHSGIPSYRKARFADLYPGVDLICYGRENELEYDFVLAPNAAPASIIFTIEGAERLERNPVGDLVLHITSGGEMVMRKPVAYQVVDGIRRLVPASFVIATKNQIRFEVGDYDTAQPLVIDPVLSYSTYLGGNDFDNATSIAADASGNVYVTGVTSSLNFPTSNAVQPSKGGSSDVFVAKLDPTGASLIYSTYLGGSGWDSAASIAVDADGNAYITGTTNSMDFPVTASAYQPSPVSPYNDVFVTKLSATGSSLLYSSYLGGSADEQGQGLALDANRNVFVVGATQSSDFPVTAGAFQSALQGSGKAFLAEVDTSQSGGASLVYSTYFGGTGYEIAWGVAVDSQGKALIVGQTSSSDLPMKNAYQTTLKGSANAYLAKLDTTQAGPAGLLYSTYLGGNSYDYATAIAVDGNGFAYVGGGATSPDFPTTAGAYQAAPPHGTGDAFVAKIDPSQSGAGSLLYATLLGGNESSGYLSGELVSGMVVDTLGNAYVTGYTASQDFPLVSAFSNGFTQQTCSYYQSYYYYVSYTCGNAGFYTELRADGRALLASSYVGAGGYDSGNAIAADGAGNVYVSGNSAGFFPVTPGAYQTVFGGTSDAFVVKIALGNVAGFALDTFSLNFPDVAVGGTSQAQQVTLTNAGSASLSISSIAGSGDFQADASACGTSLGNGARCAVQVTFHPTGTGPRSGVLTFTDSAASSPQSVSLSGNGLVASTLSVSATSLDFGSVTLGASSANKVLTLTNTGPSTVVINSFTLTGANASEFVLGTWNCPTAGGTLAVNASCSYNFTFTPASTGTRSATFTIYDNSSTGPHIVPMTGTGVATTTINISPGTFSFAGQAVGTTSAVQTVTLSNTGSGALGISSIIASNADFAVWSNTCGFSLAAGSMCTIGVVFTPVADGARTALLLFTDTGPGTPQSIGLSGSAFTLAASISPSGLSFAGTAVGSSAAAQAVTVTNTGTGPLTFGAASFGGTNAGDFSITSSTCPGSNSSLAAGLNCTYQITFAPLASGARTATFSVADNSPTSPHVIPLGGSGLAAAVTLTPSSLNFGNQTVGSSSAPVQLTIGNTGNLSLTVSGISSNSGDFKVSSNSCSAALSPGSACSANIVFAPTAAGARAGSIIIADNAPNSPQTVATSGTGVEFSIAPPSGSSNSQTVTAGQAAVYALALSGTSGATGTVTLSCTGLPQGAACGFSPASPTLNGSSVVNLTVTITTTPRTFGALRGATTLALWLLGLPVLGTVLLRPALRGRRPSWRGLALMLVVLLTIAATRCGGGGGGSSASTTTTSNPAGTPAGVYAITVSATNGSTVRSTTLTLTVQ
ncbi:MAG: choice-of-anchor D domain-containing protein [Terriglobales bacterium]